MKQKGVVFAILLLVWVGNAAELVKELGVVVVHEEKSRAGSLTEFVRRLNEENCKSVAEIIVLTSKPESPEVIALLKKSKEIAKPLNFRTINANLSSYKFKILDVSSAQLFYFASIGSNQTCEDISRYLQFAQIHMAAGIIPLIGEFDQTSLITIDNSQKNIIKYFGYWPSIKQIHYQIVENIRLISRHTLQLAESSIKEMQTMRKALPVQCQEIFLNFIAAHFYPEMRSKIFKFKSKLTPVDFFKTSTAKVGCIRNFIDVLGYLPLYYQRKVFNREIWKNPNFEEVVELKRVTLNAEIMMGESASPPSEPTQTRLLFTDRQEMLEPTSFLGSLTISQQLILIALSITMLILTTFALLLYRKVSNLQSPKIQPKVFTQK